MKYIVTSSLNADNIIATESISPLSHYSLRAFGYKSFCPIKQLPYNDCLLLFSEIPSFTIEDSDRENYPMVLQIEDVNATKVGEYEGCEIFAYNDSINLSPLNCKLLFFSDKAKVLTHQNCLDSKMSKLVDFFQFERTIPSMIQLDSLVNHINKDILPKGTSTEKENQHNRIKGFVYGYYIGKTKSLPSDVARLLSIQKRVYDIVSSILNNDGNSNLVFDEELSKLDAEYSKLDPNKNRLRMLWEDFAKVNDISTQRLNNILGELGVERDAKINFCKKKGINLRKTRTEYSSWDLASYNHDLELYTQSIIRSSHTPGINLFKELDVAPDYSTGMLFGEDETSMFFNKILAHIIWGNVVSNIDELRVNRFEVATRVTQTIKVIYEGMGKEWNGSNEQLFFHHLRQNIQSYTPFSPIESNNVILQSLAAFILKGEDYQALINYLESNSICEYQYALALWGATIGYVQIYRTIITSEIPQNDFISFYKDVQKLLYGNVISELMTLQNPPQNEISTKEDSAIDSLESNDLYIKVQKIIAAHPLIKKNMSEKDMLVINDALSNTQDEITFINLIYDKLENPSKGIFPKLKNELYPDFKKNQKHSKNPKGNAPKGSSFSGTKHSSEKKSRQQERGLFDGFVDGLQNVAQSVRKAFSGESEDGNKEEQKRETSTPKKAPQTVSRKGKSILDDKAWIYECASLISDSRANRQFIEDMEWFVGNHNDTYNDKKNT